MKKSAERWKDDDLRPEYDLKRLLRGAVRGKYTERFRAGTNLVLLHRDVARAFPTESSVNEALRLVIRLSRVPSPARHVPARG